MKRVTSVVAMLSAGGLLVAACGGGDSGGGAGGSGNTAGIDGGGGTSAGGNAGTGAGGSGGGTAECASDAQCVAKMPATDPPDCAEAKCDLVLKKCNFVAKDADGDGHASAKCVAVGSGAVDVGDDCDDDDAQTYPGAWDGPADASSGKSDACDSIDNDCDGATDNQKVGAKSCKCDPTNPPKCNQDQIGNAIAGLDSSKDGVGVCKLGVSECLNGVVGKCLGAVGPAATESCNGADDNCNGQADEGDPGGGSACKTGKLGVCDNGTNHCQSGKIVCVQDKQAGTETCNGQDDDCDGAPDDGLGQTNCGVGECKATVENCVGGQPKTCLPGSSSPEICDGKDNDCDTKFDEPFGAVYVWNVIYNEVGAEQGTNCTWSGAKSIDCNAGASRYCQNKPPANAPKTCYATGAFECDWTPSLGKSLDVTCFAKPYATLLTVTLSQLSASSGIALNGTSLWSVYAKVAIKRYCKNLGYGGGVGPLELGATNFQIACLSPEIASEHTVSLSKYGVTCDLNSQDNCACTPVGGWQYVCNSLGKKAGGWGPVEVNGDAANILCFASPP